MAARTRFCAQFTRSGRENQIAHRQSRVIIAAIVGAEVALNLEADVRVGVVAEVIIAIIDWASWAKVCVPVPCLHANGGVSGGKLLVLGSLGGVGRRSGCKNQGERNGGYHQLDRKRCHGCILSSCRRSLPYPTSAAAQGRMVVHSITTRCRNIRGRQGLDALQTLSRRHRLGTNGDEWRSWMHHGMALSSRAQTWHGRGRFFSGVFPWPTRRRPKNATSSAACMMPDASSSPIRGTSAAPAICRGSASRRWRPPARATPMRRATL